MIYNIVFIFIQRSNTVQQIILYESKVKDKRFGEDTENTFEDIHFFFHANKYTILLFNLNS